MRVSCALYDQLELAAMRKQKVWLTFENLPYQYEGYIKTLSAKAGQDYMVTPEGEAILLDGLMVVKTLKSSG